MNTNAWQRLEPLIAQTDPRWLQVMFIFNFYKVGLHLKTLIHLSIHLCHLNVGQGD